MSHANPMARLPGVDRVLNAPDCQPLIEEFGRAAITDAVRVLLADSRQHMAADPNTCPPGIESLVSMLTDKFQLSQQSRLRPVLNLTGTVLHTNLGRAILPPEAIDNLIRVSHSASNLEFDLATGKRGDRDTSVEALICQITGAEAATVVNNNAAAVLLVLQALGQGKEIPVSRGELVEIGGSFRIPEIMTSSGCKLVEVGATNRTHLQDFANAINDQTALLMKVHTSNYEIKGFTASVPENELAALAHEHAIPFVNDLGSGTLIDLSRFGLPYEPTAQDALAAGADLVTFSGDKLLGGPQAGIIVGRKDLIDRLKASPLKRALRVDKMTMVALYEVLKLYRHPDTLQQKLPTLRYLSRPADAMTDVAEALRSALQNNLAGIADVAIIDCMSQIGSGSLPLERLPSKGLAITPCTDATPSYPVHQLALAFRELPLPMVGRIHDGQLIFDVRTLEDAQPAIDQLSRLSMRTPLQWPK
jgi:L-seryl-tRNA(Ser) seleniumtransferase